APGSIGIGNQWTQFRAVQAVRVLDVVRERFSAADNRPKWRRESIGDNRHGAAVHRVGTEKYAGPGAKHGLCRLIDCPGETEARREVLETPVIHAIVRAQWSEAERIGPVEQKVVHFGRYREVVVADHPGPVPWRFRLPRQTRGSR